MKRYRPKSKMAQMIYSYAVYEREYKKQSEKLARHGLEMLDTKMDRATYARYYENVKNDLKAQVLAGDRKSSTGVIQYIVREQAYGGKYEVAKELLKSGAIYGADYEKMSFTDRLKKTMEIANLSYEEFRPATSEESRYIDWSKIKAKYKSLKNIMSKEKASQWISKYFFGSPTKN